MTGRSEERKGSCEGPHSVLPVELYVAGNHQGHRNGKAELGVRGMLLLGDLLISNWHFSLCVICKVLADK